MKTNLNFDIFNDNSANTIKLYDYSEYLEYPENPIVEVEFPSGINYMTYFRPNETTILTSKLLGYNENCIDFPDGIYSFRISIAPNAALFTCKNFVNFQTLKKEIALFLKENKDLNVIDKLCFIDSYLEASQNLVNDDKATALDFYNEANNLFTKLKCNGM